MSKNKWASYFQSKICQKQEPGQNLFSQSLGAPITRNRLKYLLPVGISFTDTLGAEQKNIKSVGIYYLQQFAIPKKKPTIWIQEQLILGFSYTNMEYTCLYSFMSCSCIQIVGCFFGSQIVANNKFQLLLCFLSCT